MKCPACGYLRKTKTEYVDDIVYYKSGKNKGQIKEIKKKEIKLEIGDEEFNQYEFSHLNIETTIGHHPTDWFTFNVCPKCKVMISS